MGYWIYGKRQSAWPAMVGGVALIAVSWLITSALWMSLVCLAVMFGVYLLAKMGD